MRFLTNSTTVASWGGVGWLSRVVFSFIIGAPNQRLVNTLTDHRETDEQPGAEAHCNKSGQRGREVKGAQLRLHGLKSLAKRFNLVVFQSVSIFSILNHPCSFMLCYNLFGVFLSLSSIIFRFHSI